MRSIWLALVAVVLCGCPSKKPGPAPAPSVSGAASAPASASASPATPADPAPFTITQVYEHQSTMRAPPWHAPGGGWTFVDAALASGAHFAFGFEEASTKMLRRDSTADIRSVLLGVANGDEGAKLVDQLAQTFHVTPPPSKWREPLEVYFRIATVEPGSLNIQSQKSLLSDRPDIAITYDLTQKKGALVAGGAADVFVAELASKLRDGPRPMRTAATDPEQVSAVGPKLEDAHDFGSPKALFTVFRTGATRLVYTEDEPERLMEATVTEPSKPWELVRFPTGYKLIDCPTFVEACLSVGYESPDVYWTDRTKRTTKKLTGPWKGNVVPPEGAEAIAPDGSFVVVGDASSLHFVPTSGSGPVKTFAAKNAIHRGWTGQGPSLRAIVESESRRFAVDPRTGESTPTAETIPETDEKLSPDKKHHADCKDGVITITDLDTKASKTFTAFEEDKASITATFCGNWYSPRYFEYRAEHGTAVLDIETMKVGFAVGPDGKSPRSADFSPDLAWAVVRTDHSLRLYRVTIR